MAVWYIDSVSYTAVTAWATGVVKAAGVLIRATAPTVGNERVFVAAIGGTTHATTQPTWPLTKGARIADNTVTWQECTGQPGVNGDLTNCPKSSAMRSTTPLLGQIIQNNAGTFLFIVKVSGACGAGEPTYNTTAGTDTTDSSCTWTSLGAVGNFTAYKAPHARIANAYSANWGASGDTYYVGDDHAETQATAISLTTPGAPSAMSPTFCADHTKAPPGSGDLKTTATASCTGNNAVSFISGGYYNGIIFNSGSGANATNTLINSQGSWQRTIFENCALRKLSTSAGSVAFNNNGLVSTQTDLINTTMQFGAAGDTVQVQHGALVRWRDTASAITGSTFPTTFLTPINSASGSIEIENVDLSALGTATLYANVGGALVATLINCKLGSGYVIGTPGGSGGRIDLINCDSGATNYITSRSTSEGSHVIDTVLVRTGGFSDGVTAVSWKIVTGVGQLSWYSPFECMCIEIKNSVLSTNRVVTIAGIWNSASLPNNDDIWLEARYLGSATSPLGSKATQGKTNGLAAGSALTADSTSAWDSGVTARANLTTYAVGNIIKVASNPGRVFFCTSITTGTSGASEPAGYASAVDGGVVTDTGATFRAGVRFSLTVTLSSPQPAQAGYILSYVKVAKQSATFWIDPYNVLS
jgi:hypothetical protein